MQKLNNTRTSLTTMTQKMLESNGFAVGRFQTITSSFNKTTKRKKKNKKKKRKRGGDLEENNDNIFDGDEDEGERGDRGGREEG